MSIFSREAVEREGGGGGGGERREREEGREGGRTIPFPGEGAMPCRDGNRSGGGQSLSLHRSKGTKQRETAARR